jgi:hypothetical protein
LNGPHIAGICPRQQTMTWTKHPELSSRPRDCCDGGPCPSSGAGESLAEPIGAVGCPSGDQIRESCRRSTPDRGVTTPNEAELERRTRCDQGKSPWGARQLARDLPLIRRDPPPSCDKRLSAFGRPNRGLAPLRENGVSIRRPPFAVTLIPSPTWSRATRRHLGPALPGLEPQLPGFAGKQWVDHGGQALTDRTEQHTWHC